MLLAWGQVIIASLIALFPIVDPVGAIPTFVVITEGDSEARRRQQLKKACVYVFILLSLFLVGGNAIMRFFGISIPGIRIAGGVILFRMAQNMLQANQNTSKVRKNKRNPSINRMSRLRRLPCRC